MPLENDDCKVCRDYPCTCQTSNGDEKCETCEDYPCTCEKTPSPVRIIENDDDTLPYAYTLIFTGELSRDEWVNILEIIRIRGENTDDFAKLDLSEAIPSIDYSVLFNHTDFGAPFVIFNPHYNYPHGKGFIIELILPDAATMIMIGANSSQSAFRHFTNLRKVKGRGIKFIGAYAFYGNTTLEEVNFPRDDDIVLEPPRSNADMTFANGHHIYMIDSHAFDGCTSLRKINFPSTRVIRPFAFANCIKLTEITESDFPNVWYIGPNAFMNNKNLVHVTFLNAHKIRNSAFEGCVSLETARFLTNHERFIHNKNDYFPHPLDPWRNPSEFKADTPSTYDSVIFFEYAFNGAVSLRTLDVRYAWNVYFSGRSLANIGEHLDVYLFDDDGTKSYGHPQIDDFLGERGTAEVSLRSITYKLPCVPANSSMAEYRHLGNPLPPGFHGIVVYTEIYPGIIVGVVRLP